MTGRLIADDRMTATHLLETGAIVPFRIVEEQVVSGSDAVEFGVRLELVMDCGDEAEAGITVRGDGSVTLETER